jgi:hypothetical protein
MSKPGPWHGRFDPSFDYLQLLGVDASDVSHLAPNDLDEIIKKKKKEWMGRALNPLYQQEAKSDLERARQFISKRRSRTSSGPASSRSCDGRPTPWPPT